MQHFRPCRFRSLVGYVEVADPEGNLCTSCRGPILGFVEREVHERTLSP